MEQSMLSVGIDIGTSTTQLVFSSLKIKNTASMVSVPSIKIVDKRVIYRSDIHFTPLKSLTEIDVSKVRQLIEAEYDKADVKPEEVDTGAVIITGETARKENAREVLRVLSGLAGDFVVATAGPALEGIIAGKGANAAKISKDRACTVVNLDIGGGTTNIAVFKNGDVIDTSCLDIGGRLIKVDGLNRKVTYISEKTKQLIESLGLNITIGQCATVEDLTRVAERMAELLEESMGVKEKTKELDLIATDHDLKRDYRIDCISFSGGVADCIDIDEEDIFKYGDIGILLGKMIKDSRILKEKEIVSSNETIRATVVGAGTHTTDISGSTITFSERALPLKNLPIIKLNVEEESQALEKLAGTIKDKIKWFKLENDAPHIALALRGERSGSFDYITKLATSIVKGMHEIISKGLPLVIIAESDMAKVLGQSLRAQLAKDVDIVCIDTVHVDDGDYIDIGNSVANGKVVPVIVKTLLLSY